MKKIIIILYFFGVLTGCDTYRGPRLSNSTGSILTLEMETYEGKVLKTKLMPDGQIALGGPTGGNDPNIEKVRVYNNVGRCVREVTIAEYGEEDTIVIDD